MQTKDVREKILNFMREESYAPMTSEELVDALGHDVNPNKFWDELLALEQNGEIIKTRFETYGLPEKMGLVAGRFQLTSKGFGFVIPDNKGDRPDVFIPPRALHGAMNNDRVLARVNNVAQGKKPEGEILRIITHANNKVVGVFHQTGDFAFVTPDDKRIGQDVYIMRKHFNGAKDGQKVVVEITEWPQEHRKAEGKVTEVLGNIGDVGLEILSIIKQNDLPLTFPDEVLEASRKVPKSIKKSELAGRRDLRERTVVTVDGEDAKDLDDAVYVEQINDNEYLRDNGSNLAAYLYSLMLNDEKTFRLIEGVIRSIAPYFKCFKLRPDANNKERIRLEWEERDTDMYLDGYSFSDGTLRFIALTTLLLQSKMPEVIIIDEPELGLHPAAINKLAQLVKQASLKSQIILSTQSTNLVNCFEVEDIIVVDRADNQSVFRHLEREELEKWMDDYELSLSDLWEKNMIGGQL